MNINIIVIALIMAVVAAGASLFLIQKNGGAIVEPARLIAPTDEDHLSGDYAGFQFRSAFDLQTRGEPLLITDPIYLADVYNLKDDPIALYIRKHGVILGDFGGDSSSPVWWKAPYLMMPISIHYEDEPPPPPGAAVLSEMVGCDSGSFLFLPYVDDMPAALKKAIDEVIRNKTGALAALPAGRYSFFYEQFEAPEANSRGLYRNIVIRKD